MTVLEHIKRPKLMMNNYIEFFMFFTLSVGHGPDKHNTKCRTVACQPFITEVKQVLAQSQRLLIHG